MRSRLLTMLAVFAVGIEVGVPQSASAGTQTFTGTVAKYGIVNHSATSKTIDTYLTCVAPAEVRVDLLNPDGTHLIWGTNNTGAAIDCNGTKQAAHKATVTAAGTAVRLSEVAGAATAYTLEVVTDAAPARPVCNIAPANSASAIANAVASCSPGSTVKFPAGATYSLGGDTIRVDDQVDKIIDGNGSSFVKTVPSVYDAKKPNWMLVRPHQVTIRNMTIKGTHGGTGRTVDLSRNQWDAGLDVYGGVDFTAEDMWVEQVFGDFVTIQSEGGLLGDVRQGEKPLRVKVRRVTGVRAARQGLAVTAGSAIHLEDNSLTDCDANCVDLEPDWHTVTLKDVHVLRNTINGHRFTAITVPRNGDEGTIDGIEIRANKMLVQPDTCYPGIMIGDESPSGYNAYNVVASGNTIKTYGDGVKYRDGASGSVTGNSIQSMKGSGFCAPPTSAPVRLINSPNVEVGNNTSTGF